MEEHYGIVPPTGVYGKDWPSGITPTLPQGIHGELSKGGWSKGNEGFVQQTFLGASISNFNISAGFGSSSTTLNVSLVNDEYNKSDKTDLGQGDDVYHNGRADFFRPPVVGSPVYFKFGKNHATLDQAYRRTYNLIYGSEKLTSITLQEETIKGPINSIPENYFLKEERPISQDEEEETVWEDQTPIKDPSYDFRGYNHFVFGGILANYTKDEGSSRTFSASVADPREILSNVQVILNDYQGTVFNNKNILNVYGFLEYDRSKVLEKQMDFNASSKNLITRDANGFLIGGLPNPLTGEPTADCYIFQDSPLKQIIENDPNIRHLLDQDALLKNPCLTNDDFSMIHNIFPITGQGMSRRCKQGIPWYRVYQALKSMMYWTGYDFGFAPCEYISAGFGGVVDFRGFNYLVDLSGLPLEKIPQMYFLDTDQVDLLSLIQDVCQAISHDYVVSLLPVLDSPRTRMIYQYNKSCVEEERFGDIVTGIIRIDTIDKTRQPEYGTVTKYIENLEENGTLVETKNVGFETSNVTTDRFIAGHQEVSMYTFSSHKDSEFANYWDDPTCWTLNDSLSDQIVPFFGFMDQNEEVVSVPKGNGPWKQIVLNAQGLDAFGVGNYYVTTELELRAAKLGFENWSKFLSNYCFKYAETVWPVQDASPNIATASVFGKTKDKLTEFFGEGPLSMTTSEVIVPRCIWPSDRNYMFDFGEPASPCSPPYGYPLYFLRALFIGLSNKAALAILDEFSSHVSSIAAARNVIGQDLSKKTGISTVDLDLLMKGGYLEDGKLTNGEVLNYLIDLFSKRFGTTDYRIFLKDRDPETDRAKEGVGIDKAYRVKVNFAIDIANFKDKVGSKLNKKFKKKAEDIDYVKLDNSREFLKTNGGVLNKVRWLKEKNEQNARKVFEFVQGVANKHLGKTYLVKMPKSSNLNYLGNKVLTEENTRYKGLGGFIDDGPYGFPPMPIDGRSYPLATQHRTSFKQIYLDRDYNNSENSWDNGALRVSFNPINKEWDYNYKPETAGGYFNVNLWSGNAKALGIYPTDSQPFEEGGRVSAYVRFPYSEYLDLSEIDKNSISLVDRSSIAASGFNSHYYDPALKIRNKIIIKGVGGEKEKLDRQFDDIRDSYVFVKCDIDDKFYHTPRVVKRKVKVFGDGVISPTKEILDKLPKFLDTNKPFVTEIKGISLFPGDPSLEFWENKQKSVGIDEMNIRGGHLGKEIEIDDFERSFSGSEPFKGEFIDQDGNKKIQNTLGPAEKFLVKREFLSTDYVYALITLPGEVTRKEVVNKSRQKKLGNAWISYSECAVPRQVDGLSVHKDRSFIDGKRIQELDNDSENKVNLVKSMSNPEIKINFSSKPPVVPDIVVLPLMSHERCYGPWVSASKIDNSVNRYSDIGGKVEYVKDENLSPWNYGGYAELQQAGVLKAQFSNSLLLFAEKGSFTFPGAPAGLTVARPLLSERGPLVTSINVNVGDSVKTTVSMDSFSPNFGKLKKQQEDFISEFAKERRKLIDERNRRIRNAGTDTSTKTRARVIRRGSQRTIDAGGNNLERQKTAQTILSATSVKASGKTNELTDGISTITDNTEGLREDSTVNYFNTASLTDNQDFLNYSAGLEENANEYNKIIKNTAVENLNNFIVPFDHQPDNPNMASFDYISKYSIDRRTN